LLGKSTTKLNKIIYNRSYTRQRKIAKDTNWRTGGDAVYNLLKNINLEETCSLDRFL
jgi:hypothetical protein